MSELHFPFSILDLAYKVMRIVFLPVYLQYSMDKAVLETKRTSCYSHLICSSFHSAVHGLEIHGTDNTSPF